MYQNGHPIPVHEVVPYSGPEAVPYSGPDCNSILVPDAGLRRVRKPANQGLVTVLFVVATFEVP
jgi:hypothetical protein